MNVNVQRQRARQARDRMAGTGVAEHPNHGSVGGTLACAICRRRLDDAIAAMRKLPPMPRETR